MEIGQGSLTVLQLAELDVKRADPSWRASYALQWMRQAGYDAAPIDDKEPYRFIGGWLEPDDRPVTRQARPIDATLLVSSDLGLADGVSRLLARPYYFVLHRDNIQGIVTRADLQRPAVGMVLFSLILASETAANTVIDRCLGPSFIERLPAGRQARIRKFYDDRLQANTQVTMLECLLLRDRLNLLGECGPVVSRLGFASDTELAKWKARLVRVRNSLAHGGTLLHAEPDPVRAIGLFEDIRSFAQKIWALALSVYPPPVRRMNSRAAKRTGAELRAPELVNLCAIVVQAKRPRSRSESAFRVVGPFGFRHFPSSRSS